MYRQESTGQPDKGQPDFGFATIMLYLSILSSFNENLKLLSVYALTSTMHSIEVNPIGRHYPVTVVRKPWFRIGF